MKKTIYILAIMGLLFGACDKIEEPYLEPISTGGDNKITVTVEFLADLSGTYNLNVFIIENGIISPQKNDESSIGPTPDWMNYKHNNLLRTSLTSNWGLELAVDPTVGTINARELSFSIDNEWNPDSISFIVFINNADNQEIIQAADHSISGTPAIVNKKVILLEEFTGHICVNCPEATILAHDLKHTYGEQLVLLSIHAGDLADPASSPFDADYLTETGTAIFNEFAPLGVPTGMINRTKYDGSYVLFKDSWEPAIQELINMPQQASIEIIVELAQ